MGGREPHTELRRGLGWEIKYRADRTLALRRVPEASVQRRKNGWNEQKHGEKRNEQSLVSYSSDKACMCVVMAVGGGGGGLKPAQVSTGMRNSGGQMSDASFLIKCLLQKAAGRTDGTRSSLKRTPTVASAGHALINHARPPKSDEFHQRWIERWQGKVSRPVRGRSVNAVSRSLHLCETRSIPGRRRNCYEDNKGCCLWVCKEKGGEREEDGWVTFWGALMKSHVKKSLGNIKDHMIRLKSGMKAIFGDVQVNAEKDSRRVGGSGHWRHEGLIGVRLQRGWNGWSEVKMLFFCLGNLESRSPRSTMILSQNAWEKTRALTLMSIIPPS